MKRLIDPNNAVAATRPAPPCRDVSSAHLWARRLRTFMAPVVVALMFAPLACQPAGALEPLTGEEIVRLTAAGVEPDELAARIESAGVFDTSVQALRALVDAGVHSDVVVAVALQGGAPPARGAGVGTPAVGNPAPANSASATFRDALRSGGEGPKMAVMPAGTFRMGCLSEGDWCLDEEGPVRHVRIDRPFALSVYEVTFEEFDRFAPSTWVPDLGWGRDRRPVVNVSWNDAQRYVAWLSAETDREYRLPSEAEWEYAARAGSRTSYPWGDHIGKGRANCNGERCGDRWDFTAPVGSFGANAFGLYDMHGNVYEWVEDCWNGSYRGAPTDGTAWVEGDCAHRVMRGGSWFYLPSYLRSAARHKHAMDKAHAVIGFRVARTLPR